MHNYNTTINIASKPYGCTKDGEAITQYTMTNSRRASVSIIDFGCTVTHILVPDKTGTLVDVCLGYDTLEEYEANDGCLGAVVGRVANRIAGGRFELEGKTYQLAQNIGNDHLHGGVKGFHLCKWESRALEDGVLFTRRSPHMEEGYPGNLDVSVTCKWTEANELVFLYHAVTDQATPINLTNHAYFNLNGASSGNIGGHILQMFCDEVLENSPQSLPTGKALAVAGTPFDFTQLKTVGRDMGEDHPLLTQAGGYDLNWILADKAYLKKAAVLVGPETGIQMTTYTTQPGMQLYTSNNLTPRQGKGGAAYGIHNSLCLETQHFPDALHHSHFPNVVLAPGEVYQETTVYQFE